MKNIKALKGSFITKFFSGILCVLSVSLAIFTFICILFLTECSAYDSSKDAAINSMRDSLYNNLCMNYCYDAMNLCVYGEKDTDIFKNTNFRFCVKTETGVTILSTQKQTDGEYIYQTSYDFPYYMPTNESLYESRGISLHEDYSIYTITGYVDGHLQFADQFYIYNEFVHFLYAFRYICIFLCLLSLGLAIASFVFLMCSAGYHANQDTPSLSLLDKFYFEFILAILLGIGALELWAIDSLSVFSVSLIIWSIFIILLDVSIILLCSMTIASRIRCRHFWKSTLTFTLLRGICHILKVIFHAFTKLLSQIPLIWQMILAIGLVCFTELILLLLWGIEDLLIIFVLEKLLVIPLILYATIMQKKLENISKELAAGNMDATVNTSYFLGTFKNQGDYLNRIKLGISQAVEDKMKSERFKTELITNVSHDIKTPLTSIINYVDLLGKEDLQNETAKEYIQIISKHSDRLKKLVVDLVDASKASSGVLKLDMKPLKIDVLLEQIAGEYTERLSDKQLHLIMRKPEDSIEILADGQRIYRIFDNLMNNIYKYAMPGTRVYLLLEKVENHAVITFKNISTSLLDISASDLMERFVRGDSSRNTEGSGLGLSIAESLVNLQKGTFRLELDGDLFKAIISFPIIET